MNILVTGANGQLGNEMRLISRQTDHHYIFTDVVAPEGVETTILDITDAEAVNRMVTEQHIQCIVNCAAYTNVDKAESDVALCRKLNAEAPKILAEAMKAVNGLLIQISTDYVFGGDPYNTPCREDQKGTPTGVYGETKLEGERHYPYRLALFRVWQELCQDHAQPDRHQTTVERGVRSGRHADLRLRSGCSHQGRTRRLCTQLRTKCLR